ncbi:hypothetical protein [Rhodococcus sp. NPDC003348]
MRVPLWIGLPAVIVLSTADVVLALQTRAVGAAARAVIRRMPTPASGTGVR